ncbi:transglycosylase SLT domain-containing protein [Azospirillum halopraeferens]|uniref:transglycosylase SLT domain-containing protein n=1 Tax=Azospirillum halopraeferens TaxID=34010 RepID=UPI001FDF6F26|nr:transglycosylase SLT domain-containing protein [Azospirillum halopraeferens]
MRRTLGGLAALAIGMALAPLDAKPAAAGQDACVSHAVEAERALNIPAGLLVSIALVESGVGGTPHPYAMSVNGRAVFAKGTEDAARHLRDAKGRLRDNVYVGCMQVSLSVHRGKFQPLERIVDPRDNVWFAGRLLVRLHGEFGSWRSAVARYNGGSLRRAEGYVCKVWQHLAALDTDSAKLLESSACDDERTPAIAPRTRRTFHNSQVAAIN